MSSIEFFFMLPVPNSDLMTLNLLLRDLISNTDNLIVTDEYSDSLRIKRKNVLTHLYCSLLKTKIPYHELMLSQVLHLRSIAKRALKVEGTGIPKFLVRVDDYPRWDKTSDEFLQFHKIMHENEVPYLIGVTPFPSRNPLDTKYQDLEEIKNEDLKILAKLQNSGVEIAMHGVTHQTVSSIRHSEIVGVNKKVLENRLSKGIEKLQSNNLGTEIFIPPFNTFDLNSVEILSKYFKVICGGPESVLYVGLKLSPSFIDKTLYLPSYYPAYGVAKDMISFVEKVKMLHDPVIVPLTLHWAWEANNDFSNIAALCKCIRGHVTSWKDYLSTALDSQQA
jgi:hypothetical protein